MSDVRRAAERTWAKVRERFWRTSPADTAAIVLRHHRIYILPTRRGWGVVASLVIMLLTAMNYALSLGYALTFVIAGLFASTLLHTFRNLVGLAAAPLAAGETFAGRELPFTIALTSAAGARRGITVRSAHTEAVTIDLPADSTRAVVLHARAERRGALALGRLTLSTDYPLGLWRGWAYVHFPLSGVVYPAPEHPPPLLPPGVLGAAGGARGRSTDAEFSGLREYQRGDAMQHIAWKAAARGAGWFTKTFEGSGGHGDLALDWRELPPGMDVEARASRLASWILVAERETRAFSLSIPGVVLPLGQGAMHRRAALTALALLDLEDA